MLPDKVLAEVKRQAELYFQCYDPDLAKAVAQLADAGWTWDAMRPVVSLIFNAGYTQGCDDAAN